MCKTYVRNTVKSTKETKVVRKKVEVSIERSDSTKFWKDFTLWKTTVERPQGIATKIYNFVDTYCARGLSFLSTPAAIRFADNSIYNKKI